jgi:hypothetical protein
MKNHLVMAPMRTSFGTTDGLCNERDRTDDVCRAAGGAVIGALHKRDLLPAVKARSIPHSLVGDCKQPGDVLTGLRDAWMTGLTISMPLRGA